MTQTETENPHKKEAGIGWGTIFAGATAVMAFVAAFTGLSHLAEHNNLDVSQDSIDNLSAMARGQSGTAQLYDKAQDGVNDAREKVQDSIDGAAKWADERLRDLQGIGKGTGQGLNELGKSVAGIGTPEQAREILKTAITPFSPEVVNSSEIIKQFQAGNEPYMKYGEGWLLQDSHDNILYLDPKKLQGIDPRNFGGLLPNGLNRILDGQNPATVAEFQKATEGKDVIGEIGRNTATAGLVVVGAGLGLKANESPNYAPLIRQNYHPVNRIDPNDAHIQLAFTARDVNNAMGRGG